MLPGGLDSLASYTAWIRASGVGWLLHSGSQAGKPEVWVSSWRTVTASLPLAANAGMYDATVRSRSIRPASTCCMRAIEVNSFDTDARSKIVSVRAGIHWSRGSSVPSPSA